MGLPLYNFDAETNLQISSDADFKSLYYTLLSGETLRSVRRERLDGEIRLMIPQRRRGDGFRKNEFRGVGA